MKDVLYFIGDLVYYTAVGTLLASLLAGMLPARFTGLGDIKIRRWITLQFCVVRVLFAWSTYIRQLIYGQGMIVVSSRQSIIPVAVSMAVTLGAGILLFRGSRMKLLSLVTAFYALMELVRFLLYPVAVGSINFVANHYTEQFLSDAVLDLAGYQQFMGYVELIWNVIIMLGNMAILAYCVQRYKKELSYDEGSLKSWEASLLFVPGLMGLLFTVMMRCILFYYETEVFSIIESYPELNVMIPCISCLCIISVLMSAKMLSRVTEEHEKRKQAQLYRAQAEELNAHVQDMESVYIQIRGMKHDMKNHIANIRGLLVQMAAGDVQAKSEVHRYVDSMQKSLEGLNIQCRTKNPVTDVILARYMRLAKQKQLVFFSDFVYPDHLGIDVFDLSIILNNGLDNAMEACEREENPFVELHAARKGHMFLIAIENSFHGELNWSGGLPVSKKSEPEHGLGLKNIARCAEKYYGRMDVRIQEERFILTVMLQGKSA